jgi:hypothetical protein
MSNETGHVEQKGVIPMGPGHKVTGACSCGWHSHSKTFQDHLDEIAEESK